MTTVVLLDIDGVLIRPGGYRAALRATLNHFARLMGIPDFKLHEEKIAGFERRGITSEWDMVPLLLGALWNDILSYPVDIPLPAEVTTAALAIAQRHNGYRPTDLNIPEFELVAGQYPADTALQKGFFPNIPLPLRRNLLHRSRDVHFSQTMRTFQHFTLGSESFAQTYNLPVEIKTESLLRRYDRSNIDNPIREKLRQPNNRLAAFTARPSAPPREVEAPHLGYAPEAEIALDLVGLPDIPLISFGKLQYLGEQRGYDPEFLLKPSPVQALAAIGAALTGNEWASLLAACEWFESGKLKGPLAELPLLFNVMIVEDTLGGVRSVWAAEKILQEAGLTMTVHAYGLTSGSRAKAEAFQHADVPYFKDWNSLIEQSGL